MISSIKFSILPMRSIALIVTVCFTSLFGAEDGSKDTAAKRENSAEQMPVDILRKTPLSEAAQRNENIPVYHIDNNALKEANVRLGNKITIISEPPVELNHFATEHGQPTSEPFTLRPVRILPSWHSELYWWHQNSVFNSRTFFQVGAVQPSHRNGYGGRVTGNAGKLGFFTGSFSQSAIRGMVNGNVLVPLPSERVPLATDPSTRALVAKFLAAYPNELPNRTDFDPRALNTNAPQRIDTIAADMRLDKVTGQKGRVATAFGLSRQRIDAFQLVAGQNPDTEIHAPRTDFTYHYTFSPATELAFGAGFRRIRSVLLPEPNAVGPRVRIGFQIQELGPDSEFPVNRARNTFHWGALLNRQAVGGRHSLSLGGDVWRLQLNGIETNNQRGYFQFTNNYGRSAIQNFLLGTPSTYEVTLGDMARGFRNWLGNLYLADHWRIRPKFQVYYGLRYTFETAPQEVNGRDVIPYHCDCNNFSPRISLAWLLGSGYVARASYTVSFAPIPPVTYQQVRYNPPGGHYIQVHNPSLIDPLHGIRWDSTSARYSPTFLSPDLVEPYVHQYNFSLEKKLNDRLQCRVGYVGSRNLKPLNAFTMNRAEPVPGIPTTTETIDLRRSDPRYYEVNYIVNGGIAYLDAAQTAVEMSLSHGLMWGATYTFGKAIDTGSDYAFTAANKDLTGGRNQWQYESFADKKGLSTFDSTHALQVYFTYDLPRAHAIHGLLAGLLNGWQISGAVLHKTGTPLTLYIGSDAPGFGNVDGGPSERPNILDSSILGSTISDPNTAPLILRRDRFSYITPGEHRGSLGRNTFRKSGIENVNAALTKQWRMGTQREWIALIRAEAYNLTNHAQFDEPQRNLTSPSFGRITNTLNDGRVLQFSLRFII